MCATTPESNPSAMTAMATATNAFAGTTLPSMTSEGRLTAGSVVSSTPAPPGPRPSAIRPCTIGISPAVGMAKSVPAIARPTTSHRLWATPGVTAGNGHARGPQQHHDHDILEDEARCSTCHSAVPHRAGEGRSAGTSPVPPQRLRIAPAPAQLPPKTAGPVRDAKHGPRCRRRCGQYPVPTKDKSHKDHRCRVQNRDPEPERERRAG